MGKFCYITSKKKESFLEDATKNYQATITSVSDKCITIDEEELYDKLKHLSINSFDEAEGEKLIRLEFGQWEDDLNILVKSNKMEEGV